MEYLIERKLNITNGLLLSKTIKKNLNLLKECVFYWCNINTLKVLLNKT